MVDQLTDKFQRNLMAPMGNVTNAIRKLNEADVLIHKAFEAAKDFSKMTPICEQASKKVAEAEAYLALAKRDLKWTELQK